jgi:2-methylcitrate dehydratase PrpD
MKPLNRRSFLRFARCAALVSILGRSTGRAQTARSSAKVVADAGDVTRRLARYLVTARAEEIPPAVKHQATRTLLNFIGVAVGGSNHESVDRAVAAIGPFAGPPQAAVLGRGERMDVASATLINGISSHVLNFDDTHLATIIHASSAIVPPALALAEFLPSTKGSDFLHALVMGMETAFRVGSAVMPDHFDAGWHITGTAGAIGAAAASGRLLGLTERQMGWAIGLAASQPVGLRESFGSMNKSFNPGRAAQNGLLAALLAARDFTSSDQMLEANAGWARTLSTKQNFRAITDDLGMRFEAALNTYLPFACAIIIHPAIDGCIRIRQQHRIAIEEIAAVELRVHPRVLQLAAKKTPSSGLEGKFSVYHAAAVALVDGKAGPRQFSDSAVRAGPTIALRELVSVTSDTSLKETQARVALMTRQGRRVDVFVEHVVGSLENPLTDQALEGKTRDLLAGFLPADRIDKLIEACWKVEHAPAAGTLARLASTG